jgi:hypothetical protein
LTRCPLSFVRSLPPNPFLPHQAKENVFEVAIGLT